MSRCNANFGLTVLLVALMVTVLFFNVGSAAPMKWNGVVVANSSTVTGTFGPNGSLALDYVHILFPVYWSTMSPPKMEISYTLDHKITIETCSFTAPFVDGQTAAGFFLRHDFTYSTSNTSITESNICASTDVNYRRLLSGPDKILKVIFTLTEECYSSNCPNERYFVTIDYSSKPSVTSTALRHLYVNGVNATENTIDSDPIVIPEGHVLDLNITIKRSDAYPGNTNAASILYGVLEPLYDRYGKELTVFDKCMMNNQNDFHPSNRCSFIFKTRTSTSRNRVISLIGDKASEAYAGIVPANVVTSNATLRIAINATSMDAVLTGTDIGSYFSSFTDDLMQYTFPSIRMLARMKASQRLIVAYPHPIFPGLMTVRTIPINVTNIIKSVTSPQVYPCNTDKTADAMCGPCDTDRFDANVLTGFACGGCKAGYYGPFCEYTSATVCARDACHGIGTCNPATRRCTCDDSVFPSILPASPVSAGARCDMTWSDCSVKHCNGTAFCTNAANPLSNSTVCKCGRPNSGGLILNSRTLESQCTQCPDVYQTLWYEDCVSCKDGQFGAYCNITNSSAANALSWSSTPPRNCSGRGRVANSHHSSRFMLACQCDDGFYGYNCELNQTQASAMYCDQGQAMKAPKKRPNDWDVLICNCTGTGKTGWNCLQPSTDMYCKTGGTGSIDRSMDITTGCHMCHEGWECYNGPFSPPGENNGVYRTGGGQCREGFYGAKCDQTNKVLCGQLDCGGQGVCDYVPPHEAMYPRVPACLCNPGWTGHNCTTPDTTVSASMCSAHGQYVNFCYLKDNTCGSGRCKCSPGYFGPTCALTQQQCDTTYCFDQGTCGNSLRTGVGGGSMNPCGCADHVRGLTSAGVTGQCSHGNGTEIVCGGYGTYKQYGNYTFSCNCPPSRAGFLCEYSAAECREEFCGGAGTCVYAANNSLVDLAFSYGSGYTFTKRLPPIACRCDAGWKGVNCAIEDENVFIDATVTTDSPTSAAMTDLVDTPGVIVANFTAGVSLTLTSINYFGIVQPRPMDRMLRRRQSKSGMELLTTSTISIRCAVGAYDQVNTSAGGEPLTVTITPSTQICLYVGEDSACQNGTEYDPISIASIVAGSTAEEDVNAVTQLQIDSCSSVVISEINSEKVLVIVGVSDTKQYEFRNVFNGTNGNQAAINSTAVSGTNCVEHRQTFTSRDGKFMYTVRKNCSSILRGFPDGFIDVFAINTTDLDNVEMEYVATQRFAIWGYPFLWDTVQFAPIADCLFITHSLGSLSLMPRDPETGLFEYGTLYSDVLPGTFLSSSTTSFILDSATHIGVVTYDQDANGNLVPRPMMIDLNKYFGRFIRSSINMLTDSISATSDAERYSFSQITVPSTKIFAFPTPFIPSSISSTLSSAQFSFGKPVTTVTVVVVGRVVLSFEKIYDADNSSAPIQYVSLVCAMSPTANLTDGTGQLCTEFKHQLDPVSTLMINTSILFSNPLLKDMQWIVVPPNAHAVKDRNAVYIVTPDSVVVYGLSVMNDPEDGHYPVSTRLQRVNITKLAASASGLCTRGDISSDAVYFAVSCGSTVINFRIDPKSHWFTSYSKHTMSHTVGSVSFSSSANQVISSDVTGNKFSLFAPEEGLALLDNEGEPVPASPSSDDDILGDLSKTEVIIVGSAIGGAIALVGLYIVAMKQGWIAVPKVFSRFVYSRVSNG